MQNRNTQFRFGLIGLLMIGNLIGSAITMGKDVSPVLDLRETVNDLVSVKPIEAGGVFCPSVRPKTAIETGPERTTVAHNPPASEVATSNNSHGAIWRFNVIAGISKQTADYYGGFQSAKTLILNQFVTINARFNAPHVFNGTFEFVVDSIYQFNSPAVNEIFLAHPGFDYRVSYDGYPTQGGGWYGPPWNSIHHSWSVASFGGTFAEYATDGIVHEFGHSRGAVDLYAIQVNAAKNPVSGQPYAAEQSIMTYPYGVTTWDQNSINLINRNADTVYSSVTYIDESFPQTIGVSVRDSGGLLPLAGANLKYYPVIWYKDSLAGSQVLTGASDSQGHYAPPVNPYGVFTSGFPWDIHYPNFLISCELNGITRYAWAPYTAPQNAYFVNPDTSVFLVIKMPFAAPSCCLIGGDASHDASVNIGDVVFLVQYIFQGGIAPACLTEADADSDLNVTIGDVVFLVSYIFSGGAAPVCGD